MNMAHLKRFDDWLIDESQAAGLVMRQYLVPVEGPGAVIFPPTYAPPKEGMKAGDWPGYNIDTFPDGSNVCLIDSVGSQANRLEPLFQKPPYAKLVPQVFIKVETKDGSLIKKNLLEVGHRAADALVRFSDLAGQLEQAFLDFRNGNATTLAKLAPTSIVFGAWDSRGTQVKIPRLVRSVVRATNVRLLHRSATYIPPINYEGEGVLFFDNKSEKGSLAQLGFVHNPASWSHGGVQVMGEIRRDSLVNLVSLRNLRGDDETATLVLRRYILGLALIAFTAWPETILREGCELVLEKERPAETELVLRDGSRESLSLTHEEALAFAIEAAAAFGVPDPALEGCFSVEKAKAALKKKKDEE